MNWKMSKNSSNFSQFHCPLSSAPVQFFIEWRLYSSLNGVSDECRSEIQGSYYAPNFWEHFFSMAKKSSSPKKAWNWKLCSDRFPENGTQLRKFIWAIHISEWTYISPFSFPWIRLPIFVDPEEMHASNCMTYLYDCVTTNLCIYFREQNISKLLVFSGFLSHTRWCRLFD